MLAETARYLVRGMKRPLVALLALAAAFTGSGQSCFRVVQADTRKGIDGCAVWCANGNGPWYTDADGLVCLPGPCDPVRIDKPGYQSTLESRHVAQARGYVVMDYAVGTLLKEVVIEHWPRKRDRHALAAVSTLDSTLISGFERSSLRSAAQWVPGVQWDERGHGGSARLSIRGSLLRSPYGVRGVKVYWGPFPLTLADGSTPLELLDPLLTGSLDITRSVGSPMYGSAPSGLLLGGAPLRSLPGNDASIEAIGGSFGYYRLGALARTNKGGTNFTAGVVHQRNEGYREQESSARDQAFIASSFVLKKSVARVFLTWQKAAWDLPGSLDAKTAAEDPRAARPYSALLDAHIDKEQLMGGLSNELRIGDHITVRTGVHGQMIDKTNPYGTSAANCGYKEETIRAVGARLSIGGDRLFTMATAWDIGVEALAERDRLRELDYVDKVLGDIKVHGDTRVSNMNAFATTTTRLGKATTLHVGAGMERTGYAHEDLLADTAFELNERSALLPYAGVEHALRNGPLLHARYAESVSRPTIWELLGTDGGFDAALQPERVAEFEVGISSASDTSRLQFRLSLFNRRITKLISAVENDEGTSYTNRGDADLRGLELGARYHMAISSTSRLTGLANVTLQNVNDPVVPPGVPQAMAGIRLLYGISPATSIEAGLRVSSSVVAQRPAVGNEQSMEGYQTMHGRVEHTFTLKNGTIGVFIHCENLLDARFTSWVQVNDPGGRFYNPAPGRSFFFGTKLTFGSQKARQAD